MPVKGFFLFAILIGSLPVCFVRPFYGILLWTVVAFVNPQSSLFYWSAALSFPWAVAIAVPTLAGFLMFCRGGGKNLASGKVAGILILWLWFTITSVLSVHTTLFVHHSEETWLRLEFVSKILFMTLVTIAIVDSFERLRILVLVIAASFGYFVLKSLPFVIQTGGAYRLYGPENSMIADNNDFGLALNMTAPLFFYLAQSESERWVKRLCGFLFIATIPAVFFTYSRGALVGLIAVCFLMLLGSKQRLLVVPVIAMGVVIALLFAPAAWKTRMDPTRADAIDGSARERLNAWAFARNLAADYPIAGGGFSTFTSQLFARYAPDVGDIHGPHSIYFQVLAEHGFVGLFLYLALVLSCLMGASRLARRARSRGDPVVASYANMFLYSLVGFLASGAFLGRAYFDYFFTIVACLIILERVSRQEWAKKFDQTEEVEEEGGESFAGELYEGSMHS